MKVKSAGDSKAVETRKGLPGVTVAVDEACTNIIEHGYGGEDRGMIEIACEARDGELVITIQDHAQPFDPSEVPPPNLNATLDELKTLVASILVEGDRVAGVRLVDQGTDLRGTPEAAFMPGMDVRAALTVVADGPVGPIGRQLDERLGMPEGHHHRDWAVGTKVVLDAIAFKQPAYVPWAWGMTIPAAERMRKHLGTEDLSGFLDSHFAGFGVGNLREARREGNFFTDIYGVTWDQTIDQDIGTPCDWPIKQPADLEKYVFPDASQPDWYAGCKERLARCPDLFRLYSIGFSLFERAWTLDELAARYLVRRQIIVNDLEHIARSVAPRQRLQILSDYNLPDSSSMELVEEIRRSGQYDNIWQAFAALLPTSLPAWPTAFPIFLNESFIESSPRAGRDKAPPRSSPRRADCRASRGSTVVPVGWTRRRSRPPRSPPERGRARR